MMRFTFCFLLISTILPLVAQEPKHHCGTTEALEWWYKTNPQALQLVQKQLDAAETIDKLAFQNRYARSVNASYTVPVVFHIVHLGGNENISDAQVQDAMRILNEDFAKKNSDTTNIVSTFKPIAANTNIYFALATKDPDGKCTNGITRHYDAVTIWGQPNQANYKFQWPANQYLNIYVVKALAPGVAGYSFYPGAVPLSMDGIVILHNYIGTIGTGNPFGARSLTHEVGHWLNLPHIWGSNNNPGQACGDDGVSDTPITKGHSFCALTSSVCNAGILENVQNYMEYSFCSNMFTQGQAARMQTALNNANGGRNNISTNANLIATGVLNPQNNCAPKAEYLLSRTITCMGTSTTFTDASYNGVINAWTWSSNNSANTSTLQNGSLIFTNSGATNVQLKVSNSFGSDSITKGSIYVLANGVNSASVGVTEGFESGTFPDSRYFASPPQFGSGYTLRNGLGASGSKCIWINNHQDNPNMPVNLFTPLYSITNPVNLQFEFKHAYAQSSSSSNDRLKVYYTLDCGQTWNTLFNKAGTNLASLTTPIANTAFVPTATNWKANTLPLSLNVGDQIYFRFEFSYDDVNGPGNNFFLDDINVYNSFVGVNETTWNASLVKVYPNPVNERLTVDLSNVISTDFALQLIDISGRVVMNRQNIQKNCELDVRQLTKGLYFLRIGNSKQQVIKKVVID
jgi:PKD repeat protein